MIVSVAIILGYTAFYGVVHSWLASQRMKDWARRTFGLSGERWYRLAYNLLAGLALLPLLPMLIWFAAWARSSLESIRVPSKSKITSFI